MGKTLGVVILKCSGKEDVKYRSDTKLVNLLASARRVLGDGSFSDAEGFEVTEDSKDLPGGIYTYKLAAGGNRGGPASTSGAAYGSLSPLDYSSDFVMKVCAAAPTKPPETLDGLRKYIQDPLKGESGTIKLPVADSLYNEYAAGALRQQYFELLEPVSKSGADRISALVTDRLTTKITAPHDEITLAGYVDSIILAMIKKLDSLTDTLKLDHKRNTAEYSLTAQRVRPDFMLCVGGALLFKGEDKTLDAQLDTAKMELIEKMADWSAAYHGEVPYLLCYAAAGLTLDLFCLLRGSNSKKSELHQLGRYNLGESVSVALLLMTAVKMYPLLRALSGTLPDKFSPIGTTLDRHGRGRITFLDTKIIKEGYVRSEKWLGQMKRVYAHVKSCDYIIHASEDGIQESRSKRSKSNDGSSVPKGFYVVLTPYGSALSDSTAPKEQQLRTAIRCILLALKHLHQGGWGHADVRWDNVVYVPPALYVLIDLDEVVPLDSTFAPKDYLLAWNQGEALVPRDGSNNEKAFTAASDLYLVGYHLMKAGILPGPAEGLKSALLNKTFKDAAAALDHEWFKETAGG